MRWVEQARLIDTFHSLRSLSTNSRLRAGLTAFLIEHPGAWPCQRQIGDDPLQLGVFILQLMKPLHLREHQPRVRLAPVVECPLADPGLATDFRDCRTVFSLLQDECDLRL
jgi:hypothetical protein